ncbi:MAG: hypothetical protein RLZZ118_1272, partial [Bacteroidota bacterium]
INEDFLIKDLSSSIDSEMGKISGFDINEYFNRPKINKKNQFAE